MAQDNGETGNQGKEKESNQENLFSIELEVIVSRLIEGGMEPKLARVVAELLIERLGSEVRIASSLAEKATKQDLIEARAAIEGRIGAVVDELGRVIQQFSGIADKNDVQHLETLIDKAVSVATRNMERFFATKTDVETIRKEIETSASATRSELLGVLATKNEVETGRELLLAEHRMTAERITGLEKRMEEGQKANAQRNEDLKELFSTGHRAMIDQIGRVETRVSNEQQANAQRFEKANSETKSLLKWLCIILIPGFIAVAGLVIGLSK